MNTMLADIGVLSPPDSRAPADCHGPCWQALERAYDAAGGFVSSDQLVRRLRAWHDQPISVLAHWIVHRDIVVLNPQTRTLIPNFQFWGTACRQRAEVSAVISELRDVFDDRELAAWFVTPNVWLAHSVPARLIDTDPRLVFEAARVDRFVACG